VISICKHINWCKNTLHALSLLLLSTIAHAKNPSHFDRIDSSLGIQSNYINKLIQRNDGFIWMATAEGISRFDGYSFVNYSVDLNDPNSLPSAWADVMFEDNQQRLWIGTDRGLARLTEDERSFIVFKHDKTDEHSISGNIIQGISQDAQDRVWVSAGLSINLYREQTNDFTRYSLPDITEQLALDNAINFLKKADNFGFWVGSDLGLFYFDTRDKNFTKHSEVSQVGLSFYDLDTDSRGNLWLATRENGVIKYNPKTKNIQTFKADEGDSNSLVSNFAWRLLVDSDDQIWVGTSGSGLSLFKTEEKKFYSHQYSLVDDRTIPSDLVTDIIEDSSGLIWVATFDGIALYKPNQVVENLRPIPYNDESLSSDLPWSFAESKEAIWIGTTEGLNREDKLTGKIKRYLNLGNDLTQQNFTAVWAMHALDNNALWLATEYGLARFNLSTESFKFSYDFPVMFASSQEESRLLKRTVWAIQVRTDGSIWAGTNDGKLYLFSTEKGVLLDLSKSIWDTLEEKNRLEFNNIIEDSQGNLWLSTSTGLYFYDLQKQVIKTVVDSKGQDLFPNDWIYATEHHSDNDYWFLTQNYGAFLLRLDSTGVASVQAHIHTHTQKFADSSLYNVYPISKDEVWFTASKNIYQYNLPNNQLVNYGSEQVLPELVFHENTQFLDSAGRLIFGSSKGVIRFSPTELRIAELKRRDNVPPLYLTKLTTNLSSYQSNNAKKSRQLNNIVRDDRELTKPLHTYHSMQFSYEHSVFDFEFLALDYANTKNIKYSYRLNGFNSNWSEFSHRRKFTFTNLPAGEYLLQVRASNGVHRWEDTPANFRIIINPPPWRTWPAYISYSIVLFLISIFGYRFWRKQLLMKYALDDSKIKLEQALWGSGDELWEWNIETGKLNKQNIFEEFVQVNAINKESLSSLMTQIHPDDRQRLRSDISDVLTGKKNKIESIYRRKTKDGAWVWLLDKAKVSDYTNQGTPSRISGTTRNVDNLKRAEEKNQLLASAFQSTNDGAIILNQKLEIIAINDAFTRITGFDSSIVGDVFDGKSISSSKITSDGEMLSGKIMKEILAHGFYTSELWLRNSSGRKIPVDMKMAAVVSEAGDESNFVITITDINYRIKAERELRRLADYDSLTSLPNRSKLTMQLEQSILLAKENASLLAVLFIDLDNFKNVNDSLGHSFGDSVLIAVAERLRSCVRRSDIIARLGGDEFTIALVGLDTLDAVVKVANNILLAMQRPFTVGEHDLVISPSIGISVLGENGSDVETLLSNADIAMYHAKNHGKNNFSFFSDSMNERLINRIALEKRVRLGLENDEFVLHYQPKIGLLSGHIVGFEALVRWNDPERGLVAPNEFIPIAEETGLILPLGAWVLNAACKQLKKWNSMGFQTLNLAVNLSALQFQDKNLIDTVEQALTKHGIAIENFELEITESSLMENMTHTIKTLNRLREFGLKLSLDDFGTGYSSLNYLKKFPIQTLKIDRSFISDLTRDKRDAKMVASIVALAHNLDLRVIGEGVEDREQLAMLHQFGVDEVQGYLLGKPCRAVQATKLLQSNLDISDLIKPISV
jgi:diguanylate cyclase (GGDEF)-like protein/PAS domain S-box-containing protein